MAKSRKSKKSKKSMPILAIVIILILLLIIVRPYISSDTAENGNANETYTIKFFDDKLEYASIDVSSGEKIGSAIPNAPRERDGYIFAGWNTDVDGRGTTITADTSITKNMSVYAVWSAQGVMSGNGYTSTSEQSFKVSENLVKIELNDLNPSPNIEGTTVTLYNPDDEKKYYATFSGNEYTLSFEGLNDITMEFNDLDQDGIMDSGEELLVKSEGGFCAGIWNIEMRYATYESGNVDFRFHIFEEGVERYDENVRIIVLDVGQADSILVFTSDGKTVLIDAGVPLRDKTEYVPLLLQQLEDAGVERIDTMILTHPDYDHIAGAVAVLEQYEIGKVYTCSLEGTSNTYRDTISEITSKGIELNLGKFEAGDYLNLSTTEAFRVLSVDSGVKGQGVTDANAASVVLRMSCATTSVLFTGDVVSEAEEIILEKYRDEVDVDILKVAHHGSKGSSSEVFLHVATPVISVISCGEGNGYGHPHKEALERLEKYSTDIVRTDLTGSWTYISTGGTIA